MVVWCSLKDMLGTAQLEKGSSRLAEIQTNRTLLVAGPDFLKWTWTITASPWSTMLQRKWCLLKGLSSAGAMIEDEESILTYLHKLWQAAGFQHCQLRGSAAIVPWLSAWRLEIRIPGKKQENSETRIRGSRNMSKLVGSWKLAPKDSRMLPSARHTYIGHVKPCLRGTAMSETSRNSLLLARRNHCRTCSQATNSSPVQLQSWILTFQRN